MMQFSGHPYIQLVYTAVDEDMYTQFPTCTSCRISRTVSRSTSARFIH